MVEQFDFNENPVVSLDFDFDFGLRLRVCQYKVWMIENVFVNPKICVAFFSCKMGEVWAVQWYTADNFKMIIETKNCHNLQYISLEKCML